VARLMAFLEPAADWPGEVEPPAPPEAE
jgi:hypothetical protein